MRNEDKKEGDLPEDGDLPVQGSGSVPESSPKNLFDVRVRQSQSRDKDSGELSDRAKEIVRDVRESLDGEHRVGVLRRFVEIRKNRAISTWELVEELYRKDPEAIEEHIYGAILKFFIDLDNDGMLEIANADVDMKTQMAIPEQFNIELIDAGSWRDGVCDIHRGRIKAFRIKERY